MRAICDWELFANVGYLQKAYLLFFILIFLVPPFSPMGAICKWVVAPSVNRKICNNDVFHHPTATLNSKFMYPHPYISRQPYKHHKALLFQNPQATMVVIVLNIGRDTCISAEIPVFYSKRYDKYKNLPDIILDLYGLIYRHVVDISADIRDENIRYIVTWPIWGAFTNAFE